MMYVVMFTGSYRNWFPTHFMNCILLPGVYFITLVGTLRDEEGIDESLKGFARALWGPGARFIQWKLHIKDMR